MHYIQEGPNYYDVHVYRTCDGRLIAFDADGNDITALVNEGNRMTRVLTERMYIGDVPLLDAPAEVLDECPAI